MAIVRVLKDKKNPYVMLNKTCLQDDSISWKAKGLHSYIMSLPDGWEIYLSDLSNRSKDGRDSTNAALKELELNGYLSRVERRGEKGKLLGGYDYTFYEVPKSDKPKSDKPKSDKPKSDKPKSENPSLLNNNINKYTYELNNNINNKPTTNKEDVCKYVVSYVEKTLGIIGPNNTIELLGYLDDGVESELIIRAIDEAIGNGKRTYRYVKGILNNWLRQDIKNSAQLTEHLNQIKNKKYSKHSIQENNENYNNLGGNSSGKYSDNKHDISTKTSIKEIGDDELRKIAEEIGIEICLQ